MQMLAGFTIAALMAINGTISVGTYVAYAGIVVWLIWPMRNLSRLCPDLSGAGLYGVMEIVKVDREQLDLGAYQPVGEMQGNLSFERWLRIRAGAPIPVK
jgi:ATP-binding cassette subfamily B protein